MQTRLLSSLIPGLAFTLFAFASPVAAGAQSQLRGRVLDIAVEDEADPWSRRDGSGYANDVGCFWIF